MCRLNIKSKKNSIDIVEFECTFFDYNQNGLIFVGHGGLLYYNCLS